MKKTPIVDDSKSMRALITSVVSSAGFSFSEAEDGVDALRKFRGETFDLVITDVNMPIMSGIELTREIRKTNRTVPILVLTTESSDVMKGSGKEAGATGWIVKPFSPEKLLSVINRVI